VGAWNMKQYDATRTAWKAIAEMLAAFGVVGAVQLATVDWPADSPPDLNGFVLIVAPAVLGAWRAWENWRKNGGLGGQPVFRYREIPDMVKDIFAGGWLIGLVAVMAMAGCATTSATLRETVTADGGSSIEVKLSQRATWGADVADGSNNLDYSGPDWSLALGNAATGVSASDPVPALSQALVGVLGAYTGVVQAQNEPTGIIERLIADPRALEILAEMLRPMLTPSLSPAVPNP
jgi:hypothetical protein